MTRRVPLGYPKRTNDWRDGAHCRGITSGVTTDRRGRFAEVPRKTRIQEYKNTRMHTQNKSRDQHPRKSNKQTDSK
ncbi:hypothetical protein KLMA_80304 [Kluyveromyces marxianus DMKU3-1042]|uniref:Uncharacterized protein n=1 Tax=Kluyveromyces marxianus (strain DMKU3-1042 / BCC 29191 / NBRC 104275) TaxID=1003335 RepID=W0TGV4_KLUMD|nr:hypothetical protein KLMA_80304 [Kluyveromyces marxianus DMKU3-1042]BAO42615.1 hypothetical protein KLMA_80304 [Kluyveromyces marxianus DMKU3-1042]